MTLSSCDSDVIVIGAGPAGSASAFHLAKNQHNVLVFDQQQFPRYKTCGGGLPLHALKQLPFDLTPALEFSSTESMLTYQGQPKMKVHLNREHAWLAMRDKMDDFLLQKACQAGAVCKTGVHISRVYEDGQRVMVETDGQVFSCRYLIGADGVNSVTARSLNLLRKRRTGVALEAELAIPPAVLQEFGAIVIFDFGAIPHGYGWIFPKREHLSVGVFHAHCGKAPDLKTNLQRFIACQQVLKQHEILHIQGHRIPLGGRRAVLHTPRCLLAGDAANLADPWLGEGIYYALRSAALAARVVHEALISVNKDLSEYTHLVNDEILSDYRYSQRIGSMVYRFPRFITALVSHSCTMQEYVFQNFRGELTFRQLWIKATRSMPKILWQTLSARSAGLPG
jgi:geranylgeranyl reductase family protein